MLPATCIKMEVMKCLWKYAWTLLEIKKNWWPNTILNNNKNITVWISLVTTHKTIKDYAAVIEVNWHPHIWDRLQKSQEIMFISSALLSACMKTRICKDVFTSRICGPNVKRWTSYCLPYLLHGWAVSLSTLARLSLYFALSFLELQILTKNFRF